MPKEKHFPVPNEPTVSRRWYIKRLGIGAAEMLASTAVPSSLAPLDESLYIAGTMTISSTALRPLVRLADIGINERIYEPAAIGAVSGATTYATKKGLLRVPKLIKNS